MTSGGSGTSGTIFSLYNGNIAAMAVNLPKVGVPMLYAYRYDQLNRIKEMSPFKLTIAASNIYSATTSTQDYRESGIRYDPSGNILAYGRNGSATMGLPLAMDQLTYWYYYYTSTGQRKQYNPQNGIPGDAARLTNQLASVKDTVDKNNYTRLEGTEDVDNMLDTVYTYDAIGNMTQNLGDSINQVGWNVYGKIAYLTKTVSGVLRTTVYQYDASGNRISKAVGSGKTTYYVRDAQGNVLSTYEYAPADTLRQTELHLYGSSRLGVVQTRMDVQDCNLPSTDTSIFQRGYKQYELSNHLGNVLATISDRHFGVDSNANGTTDYYVAEVVTEQDYYPFGMQMPGRKFPNYQPAPPAGGGGPTSPIELYRHSFTTPASGSPYTAAPNTLTAYVDSSKWTATNNRLAGVLIPAGGGDYGLQLDSSNTVLAADLPSNSAVAYTLTLYVKSGYRLSLTGWAASIMRYTNNGFGKWRLFVNGNGVAIYSATTPTTLTGIGGTFSSQINGLTGTVKIQLGLTEKMADSAKFLLDNFVLNGFVQKIPTSADIGLGGTNAEKYRYGFNGQELDNEISGDGNSYGAEFWEYDARIGRRWNIDPVVNESASPYACLSNNPIARMDPNGDSDTASSARVEIYKSVMSTASANMKSLAEQISKYEKGISAMKGLINQQLVWDLGMVWNPFYWVPETGSDIVDGNKLDFMTSQLAARVAELQDLTNKYNREYDNYKMASKALRLELAGSSHLDFGGVVLDRVPGTPKLASAGVAGGIALAGGKFLNKNNKAAEGVFAMYEIIVDGETFKYGIADAERVRRTGSFAGLPERLAQQLSKIGKYAPDLAVTHKIHTILRTSKAEMLVVEADKILAHARQLGVPIGNVAHVKKWAEAFGKAGLGAKALTSLSKFLKL